MTKQSLHACALSDARRGEHLWLEWQIQSVANVAQYDIREFLRLAAEIPLRPEVTTCRLEEANHALLELKRGRVRGAKVLVMP